jgi:hypothetical protein
MTFSYLLSDNIGKTRLTINDKDTLNPVFTDEEIQSFLDDNGDNVNLASACALESWAASYAANADSEKIGDYSYSQSITKKMLDLAATLREKENNTPSLSWAEPDFEYLGLNEDD